MKINHKKKLLRDSLMVLTNKEQKKFNLSGLSKNEISKIKILLNNKTNSSQLNEISTKAASTLLNKVDHFLFSSYIGGSSQSIDINSNLILINHRLNIVRILKGKGLVYRALIELQEVEEIALKYEYFHELYNALRIRLSYLGASGEKKETQKTIEKIKKCIESRNALEKILLLIDNVDLLKNLNMTAEELISEILKIRFEIRSILKVNPSKKGYSFLCILDLELYKISNDTEKYIKKAIELREFMLTEPAIYSEKRIVYLNSKVANYYIQKYEFIYSKKLLIETIEKFKPTGSINSFLVIKNLIISHYYLFEYDKNIKLINKFLKTKIVQAYQNQQSLMFYYRSANFYMLSEFRKARIALNQAEENVKDNYEWNAWVRLLRILITIELKKFELVEYQIHANRKYLSAHKSQIRPRLHCINKLLLGLIRNDFDFNYTSKKKLALLESLENDPSLAWNINSPELIQFHNWYKSKSEGTEYKAVFTRSN